MFGVVKAFRLRAKLEGIKSEARSLTQVLGESDDMLDRLSFCSKVSAMDIDDFGHFTEKSLKCMLRITQPAVKMPQWAQEELKTSCPALTRVCIMLKEASEVESAADLLIWKAKYLLEL